MLLRPTIVYLSGDFQPPDEVFQQRPPFSNVRAMEVCHLEHFKKRVEAELPHLAFRVAGYGPNPPDFLIYRTAIEATAPLGLELTTFGKPTEVRQRRHWNFSRWHDRLLEAFEQGRLKGLSGLKFDISFGGRSGPPPVDVDEEAFRELVDALEAVASWKRPSFGPDAGRRWVEGTETMPEGLIAQGAISWSVTSSSTGPFRGSALAQKTGFDVELTVQEHKKKADVVRDLNDTIQGKDAPGNDELLIVAGGPAVSGRAFAASSILAQQAIEGWQGPVLNPLHLKRVFLDDWGGGFSPSSV